MKCIEDVILYARCAVCPAAGGLQDVFGHMRTLQAQPINSPEAFRCDVGRETLLVALLPLTLLAAGLLDSNDRCYAVWPLLCKPARRRRRRCCCTAGTWCQGPT